MEMSNIADATKQVLESVSLTEVNLQEVIGTGKFSTVHKVGVVLFEEYSDGKTITTCAAREFEGERSEILRYLERVETVCTTLWQPGRRKVEHPNLVRFVGVWFQPPTELPLLVSEKMDTSLANYLKTHRKSTLFISFLRDVAYGLEFLHDLRVPIIHGDLTAKSIFISGVSTDLIAKIGDLGVCEILGKGVCPSCSSYRSPEAHKSTHDPCAADDIYAFGVMVMHTLLQEYPEEHKRPDDPERFSSYFERLTTVCKNRTIISECVSECLNTDPSKRPSAYVIFAALDAEFDGRASAVTLQGLKSLAKAQAVLKKKMKSREPLTILITGKTGSGKSSLTNGLVGKTVAKEGHLLTSSTKQISVFEVFQGSVPFFVVDSPGLQDYKKDDKVTLKMIKKQLTRLCRSFDLVVYCINMTSIRVDASEKTAIIHLTKCFGESMWKNAVFLLTFANQVQLPLSYEGPADAWFKERLQEFQVLLHDTLSDEAKVSKAVAEEVPIIPTGYWKVARNLPDPWKLPDRPDWFNVFWLACALRMKGEASIALFESQAARITNKPITRITGTATERLIYVPPEYAPVSTEMGIKPPKVRVVAASFVGTMVGGCLGALLGIPGGPIGIAGVAVAGAVTGAAVGGAIGLQQL